MGYSSTNIHFDYDGQYAKSGDDYEWIPSDGRLYGISFKTSSLDEITYSCLKKRICKKKRIDPCLKRMNLSYIPLVVEPKRQSYILDDEDVYVYLTSVDKEGRRIILHVEVIEEMEQQSVVEKESSYGGNYSELASGLPEVEAGEGGVDSEGDVDNSMGVRPSSYYVELPRVAKEKPVVKEWEDGLGLQLFQEFESKEAVKDIIDKASQENCFGISICNSDRGRYVVKCRGADEGCKWSVRATKIDKSEAFSIRTYRNMHSCSRVTSSTGKKRKVTPRCVAAIVHKDYLGLYETPTAKILVGLVQRKLGVEVSYTTCLRGKKQAVADIRGDPEKGYIILPAYLYMLEKANPDTKTSLVVDKNNRFRYLFVALGASIEGFEYMRKVITVDATFLKTVEGGCLIIATAQDPNLHHYPIAFAVVDGEKNESWKWFFTLLKTVIPDSTELVFVSDRNPSLIKAVGEVYLMSKHGYCIWHLIACLHGYLSISNFLQLHVFCCKSTE
ncbi:uncharacterized protein LOC130509797 [Raphanus sativus]|uniref:Uncharacterized protein LOC130509797 n=1 Tax=Raphanus sativus TaxID=3726 RepID=A0A9W3DDS6_RAPSA|nr:uncharacterized protein LOC130509797 [Raphanus sativus]